MQKEKDDGAESDTVAGRVCEMECICAILEAEFGYHIRYAAGYL